MRRLVSTTLTALLIVGCGQEVDKNASYDDILALRDAVEASGHSCDTFEIREEGAEGALETADCTQKSVLGIFGNAADAEAAAEGVNEIVVKMLGITSTVLVGPNWSVNCGGERKTCEGLQRSLGGELVTLEP